MWNPASENVESTFWLNFNESESISCVQPHREEKQYKHRRHGYVKLEHIRYEKATGLIVCLFVIVARHL